jgi:ATP-dependent Lhr-like helicase
MQKGKRVAPQIQRTRSDDLLASVFPHASACPETMTGDIEIPDHPLVREVMKDTLTEAMDLEGLLEVLSGIAAGTIRCIAVDTPIPSVFAHELINAMPYAFLDPEDAAARRTRAVSTRGNVPARLPEAPGRLDPSAIATVRAQLWPDLRDEHELHDLLLQLIALPVSLTHQPGAPPMTMASSSPWVGSQNAPPAKTQHWPLFFDRLAQQGRAHCIDIEGSPTWIATERLPEAALLWPDASVFCRHPEAQPKDPRISSAEATTPGAPSWDDLESKGEEAHPGTPSLVAHGFSLGSARVFQPFDEKGALAPGVCAAPSATTSPRDTAHLTLTQGYLQLLGPTTSAHLATLTHLHPRDIHQSLLTMEMQGLALRGVFEHPAPPADAPHAIEWCERRILQRIHRLTLGTLRKQVEPVTPAIFMRWLLDWHHLAPQTQLTGEEAVLAAIEQLEGFEAPAIEWERTLLPARVANYSPQWLDNLCLAGVIAWGRISPHPAWSTSNLGAPSSATALSSPQVGSLGPRRVIPTTAAPITFYLRDSSEWLHHALASKSIDETILTQSLSPEAQTIRTLLREQGAAFTADLQRLSGLTKLQTTTALWELATAGLASADGFDQLRVLMDPRRKSAAIAATPATSLRKRTAARTTAGRWSLLSATPGAPSSVTASSSPKVGSHNFTTTTAHAIALAKRADAALDAHARILLCRYGVLFRELLTREANAPKWRDLLPILRRLEARGEIRGGRFVSGPFGEQYALPEAVDSLRKARTQHASRADEPAITVSAADPLNLAGILVPGDRIPAIPGRTVSFLNGVTVEENPSSTLTTKPPKPTRTRSIPDMLRAEALATRTPQPAPSPGLFS